MSHNLVADIHRLENVKHIPKEVFKANHEFGVLLADDSRGIYPFIRVFTDYFGGCGDQRAELHTAKGKHTHFESIDEALKSFGVKRTQEEDEFDVMKLGNFHDPDMLHKEIFGWSPNERYFEQMEAEEKAKSKIEFSVKNAGKFNYKIYDKRSGKFMTAGCNNKSTWKQPRAVYNHIQDLIKNKRCTANDIEVVLIPLAEQVHMPSGEFISHFSDRDDLIKKNRAWEIQKSQSINKIRIDLENYTGWDIRGNLKEFVSHKLHLLSDFARKKVNQMVGDYEKITSTENPYKLK